MITPLHTCFLNYKHGLMPIRGTRVIKWAPLRTFVMSCLPRLLFNATTSFLLFILLSVRWRAALVKGDCLNPNRFCGPGFSQAGLKFRDERDRVESVADQSRTGNTAGIEYLKAVQIEPFYTVCVCVRQTYSTGCICVYGPRMTMLKAILQNSFDRDGDRQITAISGFPNQSRDDSRQSLIL